MSMKLTNLKRKILSKWQSLRNLWFTHRPKEGTKRPSLPKSKHRRQRRRGQERVTAIRYWERSPCETINRWAVTMKMATAVTYHRSNKWTGRSSTMVACNVTHRKNRWLSQQGTTILWTTKRRCIRTLASLICIVRGSRTGFRIIQFIRAMDSNPCMDIISMKFTPIEAIITRVDTIFRGNLALITPTIWRISTFQARDRDSLGLSVSKKPSKNWLSAGTNILINKLILFPAWP